MGTQDKPGCRGLGERLGVMALTIFKAIRPINGGDMLDADDEFYRFTHAISPAGEGEHTLCGISGEEWCFSELENKRRRVTCPICLNVINECKTYTGR